MSYCLSYRRKDAVRMNTASVSALVLIACIATFTCPAVTASDVNNIRFPEKAWDSQLLYLLESGPRYLDRNLEFDIPSPPANDSEKTQQELRLLQQYAASERTNEVIREIQREAAKGDFVEIFLGGGPFNNLLKTAAYHVLSFADKEVKYFVLHNKRRFSRPRPSQLLPELVLVVENPGHAAYPSGHATQSMIMAEILGLIVPEKKTVFVSYAKNVAKRREIAGVHFPSDSTAGQSLAKLVLAALLDVPEFNSSLQNARNRYEKLQRIINQSSSPPAIRCASERR